MPVLEGKVHVVRTRDSGKNWSVSFYDPARKVPYQKALHTTDLKEAIERAHEHYWSKREQIKRGEPLTSITARELVDRYLKHQELRVVQDGKHDGGITPDRFKVIRGILQNHFLGFIGIHTRLNRIPAEKFEEYLAYRATEKTSPATLRNEISLIKAMLKFAQRRGFLAPSYIPEFPKIPANTQPYAGRRSALMAEEWVVLCDYLEGWHKSAKNEDDLYARKIIRAFVLISGLSGLRVGEMKRLKWSMLDFFDNDPNRIRMRVPDRAKSGFRNVFPTDGVADLFREIRGFSPFTEPDDLIFADRRTRKFLSGRQFNGLWHLALKETKLDQKDQKFEYGGLRHTYCTYALLDGISPEIVSHNMGTGLLQMMKHYSHITPEMAEDQLRSISKLRPKHKKSPGMKLLKPQDEALRKSTLDWVNSSSSLKLI